MGGTIYHAKRFVRRDFVGNDGKSHFEVETVKGDSDNMSHSSWREIKDLAEANGMPRSAWPEFMDHEFGVDVPLEEVDARQAEFRRHLLALPPDVIRQHCWLERLTEWVGNGETVFFCGC